MRGPSRALARRYARALLEVVLENKGDAEGLRQDLREVGDLLLGNPELARVLQHPAVGVDRKRKVLAALWQKARLMRVYEGPSEVHRQAIARRVLGLRGG